MNALELKDYLLEMERDGKNLQQIQVLADNSEVIDIDSNTVSLELTTAQLT